MSGGSTQAWMLFWRWRHRLVPALLTLNDSSRWLQGNSGHEPGESAHLMPLIAYRADTGDEVESFSAPAEVWSSWRKLAVGAFVVGRDRVPAVLKRSSRGLQFFARASGYGGTTEPESPDHQLAKIALVQGLRAAGYSAVVERPGRTPEGDDWVADVYLEAEGRAIAFEVQLSQQHWDQYRERTARYAASGVKCLWLVRSNHGDALRHACIRHLMATGLNFNQALNQGMPDMPWVHLEVPSADARGVSPSRVVVRPTVQPSPVVRLPLAEFAVGVAQGRMRFEALSRTWTDWLWYTPAPPAVVAQLPLLPETSKPPGLIL